MLKAMRNFIGSCSGSVTTDWIVLTAGLMLMAFMVVSAVSGGTTSVTDGVNGTVASMEPSNG